MFGGVSSEHGVSCLTAAGVVGAIDRERYDVVGLGITRTGRWAVLEPETIGRLQVSGGRLPELTEDTSDACCSAASPVPSSPFARPAR